MKKLNLLIVVLMALFSTILFSQDNSAIMKKVDSFGYSYPSNVLKKIDYDNNGNFILIGIIQTYVGSEIYTAKYDSENGNQLWSVKYDSDEIGGYRRDDFAYDFSTDSYDNIFVVGANYIDGGSYDFKLLKYSMEGELLIDTSYHYDDKAYGYHISVDREDNLLLIVKRLENFYLMKISNTGDIIWEKNIGVIAPIDMQLGIWNTIHVLTSSSIMTFSANGNFEWSEGGAFRKMELNNIFESIFLFSDKVLYQYSFYGDLVFKKEIEYLNATNINDFSTYFDNIVILGEGENTEGNKVEMLYVYDFEGNLISDFSEKVANYIIDDCCSISLNSIEVDREGNIVLGGYSKYEITSNAFPWATDFYVLKLQADGTLLWKTSFRVESDQSNARSGKVSEISINEDGNIFVGGSLYNNYEGNGGDYNSIYLFKIEESISNIIGNNGDGIYSFNLSQNYPNPFNPSTVIKYQIPNGKSQNVNIKVYDVLGKEVATLVNKEQSAGSYEAEFDARGFTSGIYFYKLQSRGFIETKKMLLLR